MQPPWSHRLTIRTESSDLRRAAASWPLLLLRAEAGPPPDATTEFDTRPVDPDDQQVTDMALIQIHYRGTAPFAGAGAVRRLRSWAAIGGLRDARSRLCSDLRHAAAGLWRSARDLHAASGLF